MARNCKKLGNMKETIKPVIEYLEQSSIGYKRERKNYKSEQELRLSRPQHGKKKKKTYKSLREILRTAATLILMKTTCYNRRENSH